VKTPESKVIIENPEGKSIAELTSMRKLVNDNSADK